LADVAIDRILAADFRNRRGRAPRASRGRPLHRRFHVSGVRPRFLRCDPLRQIEEMSEPKFWETGEVAVRGHQFRIMFDRECGEVRIAHERRGYLSAREQFLENRPVPRSGRDDRCVWRTLERRIRDYDERADLLLSV
jgi:hypothetical protein